MKPEKHMATPQSQFDAYVSRVDEIIVVDPTSNSYVKVVTSTNELARNPATAPKVLKFMAVKDGYHMGIFCNRHDAAYAAGLSPTSSHGVTE